MSHLDTAYKLGALQAYNDFVTEVEKDAQTAGGVQASAAPNPVAAARRAAPVSTSPGYSDILSKGVAAARGAKAPLGGGAAAQRIGTRGP
jgi:hypothetical protein